jgi:hypothetical protein
MEKGGSNLLNGLFFRPACYCFAVGIIFTQQQQKNIFHFYPTIFSTNEVYIRGGKFLTLNQHLGNTASHNGTGLQKAGIR